MARENCLKCRKAISACICPWVQEQSNQTPFLVLQHSDEVKKTLGTARLLSLGLKQSKVISGLIFEQAICLKELIKFEASQPILLYAHEMSNSPFHITLDFETEIIIPSDLSARFDSVILLDGTWRNTRELLHQNIWLQSLPTISLKNVGKSDYRIRKASQENALATIEAASKILSVLEENFDPFIFLKPFQQMIDAQIQKMGQGTYQRNYGMKS